MASARSGRPLAAQRCSSRLREYDRSALVNAIAKRCSTRTGMPTASIPTTLNPTTEGPPRVHEVRFNRWLFSFHVFRGDRMLKARLGRDLAGPGRVRRPDQGERIGDPDVCQQLILTSSHRCGIRLGGVVIAAEVQEA